MAKTKIKLTPKEFSELLHQTSLEDEQKELILELLPHLTVEQINSVIDELRKNAEEFERILVNMEAEQDKLILDYEIKLKQNNQQ